MSQFFMNQKNRLVSEAIEGTLLSSRYHNISLLDVGPDIRVVVRNDWDKNAVALISGGGSGHEPAHSGFVGKGMLTAAVCGDIFASPSVDAVLSAIINVTGEKGCLLIVKNYTGDRLNFGLAAEKARALGYQVELVMVCDDISLPENPQPRGIAGTVLVHKIAGYAAAQGKYLQEVVAVANDAINALSSIGVALSGCHMPGEKRDERVEAGCSELGMGIHGEPGASTLNTQNSQQIVALLAEKLMAYSQDKKVALLVNNLGGCSMLEMAALTRQVLCSPLGNHVQQLIGPVTLVSALDMKGFSLSVLALSDYFSEALCAPVETSGWHPVVNVRQPTRVNGEKLAQRHQAAPSENDAVAHIVETVCRTLLALESELNQLDARVGDGDTGSTFALGAGKVLQALRDRQLPLNELHSLLKWVGDELAVVMGGSGGVLMSIMFTAAGQQLAEGKSLAQALNDGLARMQHYGGARPGDRTMIDALAPAFAALERGASLSDVAAAARKGADSTAQMESARAGRSSFLNAQSLHGVKDPGAFAVERVFAGLAE
ncbi:dihydroxyacetone kinase subunit DhaK [Erwinia mallotivora]|uniref:Dihydroxyacetone kinase n=1 Tax=Erwinia mallotivora TaxID=69222 RepID=A0A014NU57_9GAMM|nr:dihydroxyacetone kinase subunit DhaK [Erwinia mallotivora]EXU77375.1 dihydroxyacetone kinase [Erwinia mallotivora]